MKSRLNMHSGDARTGLTRRGVLRTAACVGLSATFGRNWAQNSDKNAGRVDVHHHFVAPGPLKPFIARYPTPGKLAMVSYAPERSIEAMDQAGVEIAMLSSPAPFGDDPAEFRDAVAAARGMNDFGAKIVADHKGRFGLFALLPMPQIEASLREIEYAFDVLKADGVGLSTSYGNRWLGDPSFRPVLDELNRRAAVVHVHPAPPCCQTMVPDTDPLTIEYPTDTSRAIWTIIKDSGSASDTAARYSNIRFIWSHAGGTLLGLVGRFLGADSLAENLHRVAAPNSRLYHLRRFYYDTAGSFSPVQMQALKTLVGHRQILFGSDFPVIPVPVMTRGLDGCGFDEGELRDVYRNNALSILPRWK